MLILNVFHLAGICFFHSINTFKGLPQNTRTLSVPSVTHQNFSTLVFTTENKKLGELDSNHDFTKLSVLENQEVIKSKITDIYEKNLYLSTTINAVSKESYPTDFNRTLKLVASQQSNDINKNTIRKPRHITEKYQILNTRAHGVRGRRPARRIFRGHKTRIQHFPFLVTVHVLRRFVCGGSIIKSDLVITAASCLKRWQEWQEHLSKLKKTNGTEILETTTIDADANGSESSRSKSSEHQDTEIEETTDEATTDGPATDEAATDGPAIDETSVDGTAPDESATDGTATDETSTDGTITDGTATDETSTDGTITDGTATDGTATDGTITDGTATDGTATDGTATDGTATDGTITDGTATDGTATDGTVIDGTVTGTTTYETTTDAAVTDETPTDTATDVPKTNRSDLAVRVGTNFYRLGGQVVQVVKVYFHPSYDPLHLENNLAILRLERHLSFERRRVSKIDVLEYQEDADLSEGAEVTIVGWGAKTYHNKVYNALWNRIHKATLLVRPLDQCINTYSRKSVKITNFCALSEDNEGACDRDAGDPAVAGDLLVGVTSFGSPRCGAPGAPTVFTNLAYYAGWIEEIMASGESSSSYSYYDSYEDSEQHETEADLLYSQEDITTTTELTTNRVSSGNRTMSPTTLRFI